jgi:hypothetical protein
MLKETPSINSALRRIKYVVLGLQRRLMKPKSTCFADTSVFADIGDTVCGFRWVSGLLTIDIGIADFAFGQGLRHKHMR